LGNTARAQRQYDRAREYYGRALIVTKRDNDQIGLARALERMGDLSYDEGQRERSNAYWVEALKIREALHHSEEAAALRERIRGGRPPRRS
jgi:tetratricopeptide (TPR) repeat protein